MRAEFQIADEDMNLLGDDAQRDFITWPTLPRAEAVVEANPLPDAETTDHIPRGNVETTASLQVAKTFQGYGAEGYDRAFIYMIDQVAQLTGKPGTLTIKAGSVSRAIITVCRAVTPVELFGVSVVLRYDFVGGAFTNPN